MTILYLTNNPQLAGTARILLTWLGEGRRRGYRGAAVVRDAGRLTEQLAADDVPVLVSPMRWPSRTRPLPTMQELWRVYRWARSQRVELVHCNEHDVYPFGVLLARLLRVPVVCHIRFQVSREFCTWAFGGRRLPDALLWTSQQQRADCAEAIARVVPEPRQHLVRLGPDFAVFTPASADRERLRDQFDVRADEVVIGSATALRPVKRIDDFVDLIGTLASRHAQVVGLLAGGVVAGDEDYAARIRQRIADSGLGRRLRWLGHLDEVEPFLRVLDVFVSTSEYETFGNSVCEAMACSLPVVGYVGGSVHEIIGDAGVVIPNGDTRALVEATGTLVTDPDRRRRLGRAGRHRVETTFDPRESFAGLDAIYRDVLARRRERRRA
jgi:glycosyltransferase involved in cell wall biosynthesis